METMTAFKTIGKTMVLGTLLLAAGCRGYTSIEKPLPRPDGKPTGLLLITKENSGEIRNYRRDLNEPEAKSDWEWRAAVTKSDSYRERIEEAADKGYAGVLLINPRRDPLKQAKEICRARNIPLVSLALDYSGSPLTTDLSSSPFDAGALAAKEAVRALDFSGTVYIVQTGETPQTQALTEGFIFYLESFAPRIERIRWEDKEPPRPEKAVLLLVTGDAPSPNLPLAPGLYTIAAGSSPELAKTYRDERLQALVTPHRRALLQKAESILFEQNRGWQVHLPQTVASRLYNQEDP